MAVQTQQLYYEDVKDGDEVPQVTFHLTIQRMVMSAASNRDFATIHHNTAMGRAAGAPDMFLNNVSCLSMWERASRQSADWQAMEFRYDLLRTLFLQVQVANYTEERGAFVPYFSGTPRGIRLVSRAPILSGPAQVRVVELFLEAEGADLSALKYREANDSSDPGRGIVWNETQPIALLDSMREAQFSFEAPAFPQPEELIPGMLDEISRHRYRDAAEWLSSFVTRFI